LIQKKPKRRPAKILAPEDLKKLTSILVESDKKNLDSPCELGNKNAVKRREVRRAGKVYNKEEMELLVKEVKSNVGRRVGVVYTPDEMSKLVGNINKEGILSPEIAC